MRTLTLALASFALAGYCNGSVIRFDDLTDQISVTIDGVAISNGGRVLNLVFTGEMVDFDITVNTNINWATVSAFTRLIDPNGSDDAQGTVSDVLLYSVVNGQPTYHVSIGSDPDLPTVPSGAVNLTGIPIQGLPADPYYEDGTFQLVGTAFGISPDTSNPSDTFYIRSDVSSAPEPGSVALIVVGLTAIVIKRRKSA